MQEIVYSIDCFVQLQVEIRSIDSIVVCKTMSNIRSFVFYVYAEISGYGLLDS